MPSESAPVLGWLAATLLLLLFYGSALGQPCTPIGLLGEFRTSTGIDSQPFGDEIKHGAEVAQAYLAQQPAHRCMQTTLIDINNSLANVDGHIRQAAQNGVRFFVGLGATAEAMAARRALIDTNSILITPTASSDELLTPDGRTILLYPTSSDIAAMLAEKARRQGIERVLVIYATNNPYSRHMAQLFEKLFFEHGGTIASSFGVRTGRISLTPFTSSIHEKSYTHVFLPLFELDAAKTILELRHIGRMPHFIASDAWGTYSQILSGLLNGQRITAIAPVIYDPAHPSMLNRYLVKEFGRRYGRKPTDLGAFTFESILLLDAMLQQCPNRMDHAALLQCISRLLPRESTSGLISRAEGLSLKRPFTALETRLGADDGRVP